MHTLRGGWKNLGTTNNETSNKRDFTYVDEVEGKPITNIPYRKRQSEEKWNG